MDAFSTFGLVLRAGAEPVEGWLEAVDGSRQPFRGYLEMLAAIERAATQPAAPLAGAEDRRAAS